MLDEYKELFRGCAESIDGWEAMSKNELCRKYVENEGNRNAQDAYFSAIMYKYWNLIPKYYYMSSNVASPEDCYEWLVDSVYGCLKAKSWTNPDSSIHNDPNGPDKVINRCMKCARLTFYQFINRKKRKNNFGMLSCEELAESSSFEAADKIDADELDQIATDSSIGDYIRKKFLEKDYFLAFMLDCIQTEQVFDVTYDDTGRCFSAFNQGKLVRAMNRIDEEYLEQFAVRYRISYAQVELGYSYIGKLSSTHVRRKIEGKLDLLKHDDFFLSLHRGG